MTIPDRELRLMETFVGLLSDHQKDFEGFVRDVENVRYCHTPIDGQQTMLHQFMYTNMPLLNLLRPLLMPFGKAFIGQDLKVVKMQQEGLQPGHPALMLMGDADAQALWYFRLKKENLTVVQN